jgi:hypothetical protein
MLDAHDELLLQFVDMGMFCVCFFALWVRATRAQTAAPLAPALTSAAFWRPLAHLPR